MKSPLFALLLVLMPFGLTSCCHVSCPVAGSQPVETTPFGKNADGQPVTLYTLKNTDGIEVGIMDYGATIVNLITPDRDGKRADVSLGFDSVEPYLTKSPYFGAIVGRFANRIKQGRFTLDGKTYQLAINNPPNTLHGGLKGFDKQMWQAKILKGAVPAVEFSRLSPDGEEGYPGNLKVTVTYALISANTLKISYEATTDQDTILNLSNHAYFNLSGQGEGTILGEELTLNASHFTPVDSTLIPTGEIAPVAGTVMDFRKPTAIGARIKQVGGDPIGYDHNYVLDKAGDGTGLQPAATVYDPKSGRKLEISTDQPGIQFYSGNFLDGSITGKAGRVYPQYSAIVLETQHFPDSPNQPQFPSVVLKPGQIFHSTSLYTFTAK
ncbi:MAG TPA: aldose epimerase family protein [Rariglobus sp.]|jgi:aldose 1-epimerase|nr:aldose epimerase family protein [Rariglobus sp.]